MAIVVEKLEKDYKVKNRAPVHALKGISFNLPDKGMVFILGKSGCGKSTLLNLLGGLDGFDIGDIKVDGKSVKSFKASEIDRYRNGYVGFVFQENNLLEKYTVKFNVALALELQNCKDTDGKVESTLESVGLKDFAQRSCNRLSGGQKQRVAIARALIKQPKLILCDEPTGALDSETGADIFTLLKELSQERLVVVVSHDRESAEKYGDRVIELKDGEIISDSAPLNGVAVTEQSKAKHGGLRFVRAFTLGAGYIIARPIRMAICLLLCLVTFTCVGVADTVYAYDGDKVLLNAMEDKGSEIYIFGKADNSSDGDLGVSFEMLESEAEELSSLITVKRCDNVYKIGNFSYLKEVEGAGPDNIMLMVYAVSKGYVEADADFLKDYGYNLLAGRLPENFDEVAIPEFLFNFFLSYGYRSGEGELLSINSYDDLLGKTVTLNNILLTPVTVTGIIDTHFNNDKVADVLYGTVTAYDGFNTDMNYVENDIMHGLFYVCEGFNNYYSESGFRKNESSKEIVMCVIAPFTGSSAQKLENIRVHKTQFGGEPVVSDSRYCYHIVNNYAIEISKSAGYFNEINSFMIYVVVSMVVISVLFVMYYASGTIDEKRREIGILRALGASRGDIVKITACEHGVFTAVAVAVSSVISVITAVIMNKSIVKTYEFDATYIQFGIRQFAVITAVALLAVIAGITFPLIKLLKKKPVDVIADRK